MTPLEKATGYALAKAIVDLTLPAVKAMREDAQRAAADLRAATGADRIAVTLPDGTRVATLTVKDQPEPHVGPINEARFLAWVEANAPEQVETVRRVRPGYVTEVLSRLVVDGDDVVDPATGEAVDYAAPAAVEPGLPGITITYARANAKTGAVDGRSAIVQAWRAGSLAAPAALRELGGAE